MGTLEGKVAVVTGAARGQGRAHAKRLAQDGADVLALDITTDLETTGFSSPSSDELQETVALVRRAGRRGLAIEADVRSQEQLDAAVALAVAELGRVDILIANAGIWTWAPFWELTDRQWSETIDINLSGVWKSAKAIAPRLIEQRSGSIVMTASVAGLEAAGHSAHYGAAKHGVIGLMRSVAQELAPYGIRCNAVCPGAVDTTMTNWQGAYDLFAGREGGTREDFLATGPTYHALAGAGVIPPDAIADAVSWLVSDQAAFVTGVALPVDAGHLLLPGHNDRPQ